MFTPITGDHLDRLRRATKRPDAAMEAVWLPFYVNGYLFRITDQGEILYFVAAGSSEGDVSWFRLDGSSDPIHAANRAAGLELNEENILHYLQFFCDFLDMEEGRMEITHTCLVKFDNNQIVPVVCPAFNGMSDDKFLCSAHAIYDGAVFETEFAIPPDGKIKMLVGNPVIPVTLH